MPALRGHHLICLQFFRGEGYNDEFVRNLEDTLKSADEHEIDIRNGADDVCVKCPYLDHARCRYSQDAEEGIAEMDRKALDLLDLSPWMKVSWKEVRQRIPKLFERWYKAYCAACSWRGACEKDDMYRQLRYPSSRKS